jgi:hypothetical protein
MYKESSIEDPGFRLNCKISMSAYLYCESCSTIDLG